MGPHEQLGKTVEAVDRIHRIFPVRKAAGFLRGMDFLSQSGYSLQKNRVAVFAVMDYRALGEDVASVGKPCPFGIRLSSAGGYQYLVNAVGVAGDADAVP